MLIILNETERRISGMRPKIHYPDSTFSSSCMKCGYMNDVSNNEDLTLKKCCNCRALLFPEKKLLSIDNLHLCDDDMLTDAYIYFYMCIEANQEYRENNKLVALVNSSVSELIKAELTIRDIPLLPIINRAIRIINANKKMKS